MKPEKQQEIALMRYGAIAPLIAGLDENYPSKTAFTPKFLTKGLLVLTVVSIIMHLQRLKNGISITKTTVLMPSSPKAGLMPA